MSQQSPVPTVAPVAVDAAPEAPPVKQFEAITSQEQLDGLLKDRLHRERSKFADYGELKAKAAKLPMR